MKTAKTSTRKNNWKKALMLCMLLTLLFAVFPTSTAYAADPTTPSAPATPTTGILGSDLFKGVINFFNDATTAFLILVPVIGAIVVGIFFAMRGMADQNDAPMWNKRIKTALICIVAAELASAIIAIITSYF